MQKDKELSEIAYAGNIGVMELIQFKKIASPEQKALLNKHIANKNKEEAWKLVQKVTKVKLHPSVSEENKYKTDSGKYKKNPRNRSGLSKKYSGSLSHSTQEKRQAHWKRTSKMDPKNPAAYEPAPGDKGAETKPSVYTKRYRERFGEQTMKIPFLLMNREQRLKLSEENASSKQITYLNTATRNFDVCPLAYKAFTNLIGKQSDKEMKMMQTTKQMHAAVSAGIDVKPEHLRRMQFKQYLGL